MAENETAARSMAHILAGTQQERVVREFNRVSRTWSYCFSYKNVDINGELPCDMVFTYCNGHLLNHEFERDWIDWDSCKPSELFDKPVEKVIKAKQQPICDLLVREAPNYQWLMLWHDNDPEGECIASEVAGICIRENPSLVVKRARFWALSAREIIRGSHHFTHGTDARLVDAVDFRSQVDLIIGAVMTRENSIKLRKDFIVDCQDGKSPTNIVASYGSCQAPVLGLIVKRYFEINSHEPPHPHEKRYVVKCFHNTREGVVCFSFRGPGIRMDIADCIIYESISQETATVIKKSEKTVIKNPPEPLTTLSLLKLGTENFRMNSDSVMKAAEDLYYRGYISYPRTETNMFSDKHYVLGRLEEQIKDTTWGGYAQHLFNDKEKIEFPLGGRKDDKAHPPLHPLMVLKKGSLSRNHHRVYDLVARHFLACLSMPAVGTKSKVTIVNKAGYFTAKGTVIEKRNYLDVYPYDKWEDTRLPSYNCNQQIILTSWRYDEVESKPPSLMTESELLTLMEAEGLGTASTRSLHIRTLIKRSYVTRVQNTSLMPTRLGAALCLSYMVTRCGIWNSEVKSIINEGMKDIMGGTSKNDVLGTTMEQMRERFKYAMSLEFKFDQVFSLYFLSRNGGAKNFQFVCRCAVCRKSAMILRKMENGRIIVGCHLLENLQHFLSATSTSVCPNAIHLPAAIEDAFVTPIACQRCVSYGPSYQINFKYRREAMPPGVDLTRLNLPLNRENQFFWNTGCIGCDDFLHAVINAEQNPQN